MNSFGASGLLLVASALLYLSTSFQASEAFDSDKLYKYDFQGAITNKLADNDKPQYSGYSIKSGLLLKKSGQDLIVKLEQPQLGVFNDVINEIHLYNYNYKPIEKAANLDKAFKIYFEEGRAKALDIYKDEPKWVSNFKRGLISLFQVQFQKDSSYFSLKEMSVFGDCETDYIVSESEGSMNVTKTRNMAKCKSAYFNRFFPIETSECVDTEKDLEEFKHSNAVFNYNLKGSRQDYVIERVILDEMNLFAPFGLKAHSHSVHSKFMIVLSGSEDGGSLSSEGERNERIAFEPAENNDFYANVNMENEHYLSNILDLSSTSVEQVMEVFDELVEEHRKYNAAFEGQSREQPNYQQSSTLVHQMYRLTQLVGTFNYQKLEQLYNQVDERGDSHKRVFWDLMSMIGTNPSFIFMKKLIGEGDAPAIKIKEYLPKMSFHLKTPSKALFDEYVNLCKSDKIAANQEYRRLCLLPLASLIHQHCVKAQAKFLRGQQPEESAGVCQLKTAEEYFSSLVAAQSEEMGISEKHFNIKMAGELGMKASLDYLMAVARNKEEHPTLRAAAMWNLIKASHAYPNQVKSFAVPFYYDQAEPTELRIAAFFCWMNTGIGLHEMETLGKQLRVEQNRQIVAYMSSLVDSLAKLKAVPCTRMIERSAKLVVPTIKRAIKANMKFSNQQQQHLNQWDSRVFMTSTWNEDYSYGTASVVSAIFTNESMTPVNLFYKSSEIMSGIRLNPMMVNLQAHRADKVLHRIIGPNGLLSGKESFFDVFSLKKHAKREADSSKPDKFTDVYLAATISLYGRTINFRDIDSKELKRMMSEDGTVKIPNVKKLLHSFNNHSNPGMMLLFEKLDMTNNELGLPIFQSIHDFQFKNFKLNTIKVDIEPGFFKDERKGKPPTRLTVSLDMKSVRHNEFFVTSGALLTNERKQIGVGLSKKKILTLPLKLSIDANLVENKLVLKREPIMENLLYIKQSPYTFIRSYDPSKAVYSSNSQWLYHYDFANNTQMSPLKIDYMTRLGIGLKMEGKHKADADWSIASWRKYLMEVGWSNAKFLYFYSPNGAPFEVAFSTITTEDNPTKELTTTISWNHHNKDDSVGLNEIEKELESYTRGSDDKAKSVHYHFTLAGGSVKERKVELDVTYSRSLDRLRHKWRVFYDRPEPLQGSQASNFSNFCWNGQMELGKGDMEKLIRFDLDDTIRMANDVKLEGSCPVSKLEIEKASIKELKEKFSTMLHQSKLKLRDY